MFGKREFVFLFYFIKKARSCSFLPERKDIRTLQGDFNSSKDKT